MIAGQSIEGSLTFGVLDQMGVINAMSIDEMLLGYSTSLNASTILTFYGATITTILTSIMVPMFYILRLNPRKIMM